MQKIVLVFFIVSTCKVMGVPKKYQSTDNGFEPSHRYYEADLTKSQYPHNYNISKPERKESKESRFGVLPVGGSYGSSASGGSYGSGGGSFAVAPVKIDIGGVVLGALIGLGVVIILPKIAQVLGGGYGYRNLENEMSSITSILARIDNSLEQNNIDSSSCMQRIICSYVNDAQKDVNNGEARTGISEFINGLTNSTLFSYMLDGTAIKQAVDLGKMGDTEKCSKQFSKCPITKENVLNIIANMLPS